MATELEKLRTFYKTVIKLTEDQALSGGHVVIFVRDLGLELSKIDPVWEDKDRFIR